MVLTRVGKDFLSASVELGLEHRVEVDVEADGTTLLAILQDGRLDVLLRCIRFQYAEVEGREPEVRVRAVVVVVPDLQEQVLRERVDQDKLCFHPCRVDPTSKRREIGNRRQYQTAYVTRRVAWNDVRVVLPLRLRKFSTFVETECHKRIGTATPELSTFEVASTLNGNLQHPDSGVDGLP